MTWFIYPNVLWVSLYEIATEVDWTCKVRAGTHCSNLRLNSNHCTFNQFHKYHHFCTASWVLVMKSLKRSDVLLGSDTPLWPMFWLAIFFFRKSRVSNEWKELTSPPFKMSINEDISMVKTIYLNKIINRIILVYQCKCCNVIGWAIVHYQPLVSPS